MATSICQDLRLMIAGDEGCGESWEGDALEQREGTQVTLGGAGGGGGLFEVCMPPCGIRKPSQHGNATYRCSKLRGAVERSKPKPSAHQRVTPTSVYRMAYCVANHGGGNEEV